MNALTNLQLAAEALVRSAVRARKSETAIQIDAIYQEALDNVVSAQMRLDKIAEQLELDEEAAADNAQPGHEREEDRLGRHGFDWRP